MTKRPSSPPAGLQNVCHSHRQFFASLNFQPSQATCSRRIRQRACRRAFAVTLKTSTGTKAFLFLRARIVPALEEHFVHLRVYPGLAPEFGGKRGNRVLAFLQQAARKLHSFNAERVFPARGKARADRPQEALRQAPKGAPDANFSALGTYFFFPLAESQEGNHHDRGRNHVPVAHQALLQGGDRTGMEKSAVSENLTPCGSW